MKKIQGKSILVQVRDNCTCELLNYLFIGVSGFRNNQDF